MISPTDGRPPGGIAGPEIDFLSGPGGKKVNFLDSVFGPAPRMYAGSAATSVGLLDARLQTTTLGRSLSSGAKEAFGYDIRFNRHFQDSRGFLGLKESMPKFSKQWNSSVNHVSAGRVYGAGRAFGAGRVSSARSAFSHAMKTSKLGAGLKLGGKALMSSLGLIGTAYFGIEGYKEGGVLGAAGGVAESIMWGAAIHQGAAMIGGAGVASLTLAPLALAGAAGIGYYAVGEAAIGHRKGLRGMEMVQAGAVQAGQSFGAQTMRQRASIALSNTHINGRMAMGNEAAMLHNSF